LKLVRYLGPRRGYLGPRSFFAFGLVFLLGLVLYGLGLNATSGSVKGIGLLLMIMGGGFAAGLLLGWAISRRIG